jgi:hypothetical protein
MAASLTFSLDSLLAASGHPHPYGRQLDVFTPIGLLKENILSLWAPIGLL